MADPYGLELSGLTPELSAEASALARRQKVAEAMALQAQQPLATNRMAGRSVVPISPFEGLAQLLRGYTSGKTLEGIDTQRADIAKRGREAVTAEIGRIRGIGEDKPGEVFQPATPNDDEGNAIPSAQGPAIPGDKQRMVTEAMLSPLPQANRFGAVMAGQVQADKALAAQQKFQGEQKAADREARADNLALQLASQEGNKAAQQATLLQMKQMGIDSAEAIARAQIASKRDLASIAGALRAPSLTTIAEPGNPSNTIVVDARVYRGGGAGSPGVIGSGPKLTEAGKLDAKTAKQYEGLTGDMQRAEDLLMGVTRTPDGQTMPGDKPTGSGVGSLVDKGLGMVGVATSGAQRASDLKVVQGRLVTRVPRFEGSQSDADVKLYKEMAGKVGDDTVPVEARLSALRTMRDLYADYETGKKGRIVKQGGATGGFDAPAAPGAPALPPGFKPL